MRSHVLDIAALLFKAGGLSSVLVSKNARYTGVFPSQVTCHFRSKKAMFAETRLPRNSVHRSAGERGCGRRAQFASLRLCARALVTRMATSQGLALLIEVLALSGRRQDVIPLIERSLARLHAEDNRAQGAVRDACGWLHDANPALRARRFWALAPDRGLRGAATGSRLKNCAADRLALLFNNDISDTPAAVWPRLFAVTPHIPAPKNLSWRTLTRVKPETFLSPDDCSSLVAKSRWRSLLLAG